MKRNVMVPMVLAAGFVLGSAGVVLAAGQPSNELSALANAKTSMEQAITIAQNTTGGKAVRIAFDRDHGRYIYRVRTLTKDGMDRVSIDAASGRVLTVASAMPIGRSNAADPYHVFANPEYQHDHS